MFSFKIIGLQPLHFQGVKRFLGRKILYFSLQISRLIQCVTCDFFVIIVKLSNFWLKRFLSKPYTISPQFRQHFFVVTYKPQKNQQLLFGLTLEDQVTSLW